MLQKIITVMQGFFFITFWTFKGYFVKDCKLLEISKIKRIAVLIFVCTKSPAEGAIRL